MACRMGHFSKRSVTGLWGFSMEATPRGAGNWSSSSWVVTWQSSQGWSGQQYSIQTQHPRPNNLTIIKKEKAVSYTTEYSFPQLNNQSLTNREFMGGCEWVPVSVRCVSMSAVYLKDRLHSVLMQLGVATNSPVQCICLPTCGRENTIYKLQRTRNA